MKHKLPEAEWYFAQDEEHLSLIDQVRIIIWANGLCLGGYDEENRAIAGKVFLWSRNWDTDKMIQIFENEPMVAGPQPITDIWINSDQQMQIPTHLFDSGKAGNWLKQFHFVEADYSILENKITEPTEEAPRVVYAVPDEVIYRLDRFFPEANTDSLSAILIQTLLAQKAEGLHLNFLDKRVVIIWIQQGVLKYVQSLNYDSCADVIYLLAELSEKMGYKLQDLPVSYRGLIPTDINQELPLFLTPAKVTDQETLLFTLLNQVSPCVL